MKKINVFLLVILFIVVILSSCGRETSRILGKDSRQVLDVPDMKEFINVSFDKNGSKTIKNVTFRADDNYIYTREFKDASLLEGVIRWVPFNEKDDVIRSRAISRLIGNAVNLKLPEDCSKILGVDIGFASEDERVKNLYYLSIDGKIYAKEYKDGLIDRHFEGWLEIKRK